MAIYGHLGVKGLKTAQKSSFTSRNVIITSFPGSLMLAPGSGKMRDPRNEVAKLLGEMKGRECYISQ